MIFRSEKHEARAFLKLFWPKIFEHKCRVCFWKVFIGLGKGKIIKGHFTDMMHSSDYFNLWEHNFFALYWCFVLNCYLSSVYCLLWNLVKKVMMPRIFYFIFYLLIFFKAIWLHDVTVIRIRTSDVENGCMVGLHGVWKYVVFSSYFPWPSSQINK